MNFSSYMHQAFSVQDRDLFKQVVQSALGAPQQPSRRRSGVRLSGVRGKSTITRALEKAAKLAGVETDWLVSGHGRILVVGGVAFGEDQPGCPSLSESFQSVTICPVSSLVPDFDGSEVLRWVGYKAVTP